MVDQTPPRGARSGGVLGASTLVPGDPSVSSKVKRAHRPDWAARSCYLTLCGGPRSTGERRCRDRAAAAAAGHHLIDLSRNQASRRASCSSAASPRSSQAIRPEPSGLSPGQRQAWVNCAKATQLAVIAVSRRSAYRAPATTPRPACRRACNGDDTTTGYGVPGAGHRHHSPAASTAPRPVIAQRHAVGRQWAAGTAPAHRATSPQHMHSTPAIPPTAASRRTAHRARYWPVSRRPHRHLAATVVRVPAAAPPRRLPVVPLGAELGAGRRRRHAQPLNPLTPHRLSRPPALARWSPTAKPGTCRLRRCDDGRREVLRVAVRAVVP